MRVSQGVVSCVRMFGLSALLVLVSSNVLAQSAAVPDAPSAQANVASGSPNRNATSTDYSKGRSALSLVGPYQGRTVPAPDLGNAPHISQLVQNGRLMLSLNDAIALALENNLDIAIARYNLNIADTDLLRTLAGGSNRGVSTGVVSGTPGGSGVGMSTGSSGSGAGGTSVGSGGAASGTSGIVSSTSGIGPAVDPFDPTVTGTLGLERSYTPISSTYYNQLGIYRESYNTGTANLAYAQGFATGTKMTVEFDNAHYGTNVSNFYRYNNPSLKLTLRQHLTQGWGWDMNRRFILTAKNNKRITDSSFQQQIIYTVVQIQNIYWDLVNAYENVKVQEEALRYNERTLTDNQKQVEIGTLAPIEVVHAQSQLASAQQQLINAQTNLQYQQLLMKNAITRNMSDPTLASAPVIPTDTMRIADAPPVSDVQQLVADALKRRPEIEQSRLDLQNRTITKKAARQALLPTVDVSAFYKGAGQSGDCSSTLGGSNCVSTSYGNAFGQMFDSSYPDKGVQLTLSIPIRNREAQADQVRSELEYRQAEMRFQQQQNNVMIDVRNSAYTLQQSRAQLDAAIKARDYAKQSLEAEQKKYELGASTSYLVLQMENSYVQAQSNVVTATTAYEKARVDLDRATGYTLERSGILIPEAVSGIVTHTPQVPDVTPRTDVTPTQSQQAPQN